MQTPNLGLRFSVLKGFDGKEIKGENKRCLMDVKGCLVECLNERDGLWKSTISFVESKIQLENTGKHCKAVSKSADIKVLGFFFNDNICIGGYGLYSSRP